MTSEITFGELLWRTIGENRLTLTAFAQRAGVHLTNVSKIASGKRSCGLSMAVRLADALGLGGPERMFFLQAASATTNRIETHLGGAHTAAYPAELRDMAVNYLSSEGIFPDHIDAVRHDRRDGSPTIHLRDGRRFTLRIVIDRS